MHRKVGLFMTYKYIGAELDTFALAKNWKHYVSHMLQPYLHGDILEVGAGSGSTTSAFYGRDVSRWVCLEPDKKLCDRIETLEDIDCEVFSGELADYTSEDLFDAVLYIDVLEHIEDDSTELCMAYDKLKKGGHLIVVAPAHKYLFSPFDEAIGHHRRYNIKSLRAIAPHGASVIHSRYLDSIGFFLSLSNVVLLKSLTPSRRQILFWDRVVVSLSRIADRLLFFGFGKTVLQVWRKPLTD